MRQTVVVLALLVTGSLVFTIAPSAMRTSAALSAAGQNGTEIAKIQAYHDQIDRWATAHPTAVRYFSTVTQEDNSSVWKAYPNKRSLPVIETHASVWIKDGKVVSVILSQKTDHTNFTDGSYFREDGTLAYREIHQYSIGLDPPFQSSKTFFDASGKVLQAKCLSSIDDRNRQPCSTETADELASGYADTLFLTNTKFPFSDAMGSGH